MAGSRFGDVDPDELALALVTTGPPVRTTVFFPLPQPLAARASNPRTTTADRIDMTATYPDRHRTVPQPRRAAGPGSALMVLNVNTAISLTDTRPVERTGPFQPHLRRSSRAADRA
jgi:hypothetical protein